MDLEEFMSLSRRIQSGVLNSDEQLRLGSLKLAAQRQGRAVDGVIGFFLLKFKPYPMLAEVRDRERLFQPMFGPVLVTSHELVLEVLSNHHEFTVDPYGARMCKAMSPKYNGGYDMFVLSTDDDEKYIQDKRLLSTVVAQSDVGKITNLIHQESQCRIKAALTQAEHRNMDFVKVKPPPLHGIGMISTR